VKALVKGQKLAQWWGRTLIKCTYFIPQKILEVIKVSFKMCHMIVQITLFVQNQAWSTLKM